MANTHRWSKKTRSGNAKCEKCGMIRETVKGIGWKTVTVGRNNRKVKQKYNKTYYLYKRKNVYVMDEVFPHVPTRLAPICNTLTNNEKEN